MKKVFIPFIFALVTFASCDTDLDYEPIPQKTVAEQYTIDSTLIAEYLESNNLDATMTESGLNYIIDTLGTGEYPSLTSIVEVEYVGHFLSGNVFSQGTVQGDPLSIYILGWQEGIQLFKEGGEGTLILPSKLGYGPNYIGSVPANSVLVFDIKLINVEN